MGCNDRHQRYMISLYPRDEYDIKVREVQLIFRKKKIKLNLNQSIKKLIDDFLKENCDL